MPSPPTKLRPQWLKRPPPIVVDQDVGMVENPTWDVQAELVVLPSQIILILRRDFLPDDEVEGWEPLNNSG